MSRWFRMYTDVLDDPKVQRLPPPLFKVWVNLLCLAGRHDGALPAIEDIAFALRLDEETAAAHIKELVTRGLIDDDDGFSPHNWDNRQFKSDKDETAAERQRKKRDRDRSANVTRDTSVTSHPPETDTEQIQIQSREEPREASALLEAKLREAAGWQSEPAPGLFVTGPIEALIANGASLELDVLPVIRGRAPKVRRPSSWTYFIGPIQDAVEARKAASTGPPGKSVNGVKAPEKSFEELAKELLPGWNPGTKFASTTG